VRSTTEAGPTTTEELDFKDVPIYEKEKLRKPPPGSRYVAVWKCSNSSDTGRHVSAPSDAQDPKVPLETLAQLKPESSGDEEQLASSTGASDISRTETPDLLASDVESAAITETMVAGVTGDEPVKLADALTAVELQQQPLEMAEGVEEDARTTQEPSAAVSADETEKAEAVESSAILGNGDGPTPIKATQPESDNVNTFPDSGDAGVNPIETHGSAGLSAAESPVPSSAVADEINSSHPDPSKNSNPVGESQVVVENVDVVASVALNSPTEFSESGDGIISDPVKNYTGYKVYRVVIPTEEVS
jgi:hypothetical protein